MKKSLLLLFFSTLLLRISFAQQAVLYIGSDWCEAGDALQTLWSGEDFRAKAGMPLAIIDEPELVTDAVKAEWKVMADIRLELECYPGLAVFDSEGRCVLLKEGLAWDTSAQQLLRFIEKGRERATLISELLAQDGVAGLDAAIRTMLPELGLKRTQQPNGLKVAWEQLEARDPKDESGVRAALKFNPIETIYKVHDFAKKKDFEGGEAYIKDLLTPAAAKRLTMNQRQGWLLHTFVLYRHEASRREENLALLKEVAAMDPTTHFGQGARGMLKMLDETAEAPENCRPEPLPLKPRADLDAPQAWKKKLPKAPVFAYAATVLNPETFNRIAAREGGEAFLKAFFTDRTWAEDFFGSGPAKPSWDVALQCLDDLAWQVPLTDRALRKWATAAALNAGEADREAMLRLFVAFANIRERKLLVRGMDELPVALMRYIFTPAQTNAEEFLWMAETHNVPPRSYPGVCWYAPYRTYNFFNDTIQGPHYYVPWDHLYNRREASRKVGGVCGSLSYYGSIAAKAHGLPSTPGGQPAHCAYSLYNPTTDRWQICYNVNPYTGTHFQLWHYSFDYLPLTLDTFADPARHDALQLFWAAEAARNAAEAQPVRSPMTCRIYANWQAQHLPKANAYPPLTREDTGVTNFSPDQGGREMRDHVVLVWEGTYQITKACDVRFTLASDDGSDLTFNGEKIIDNDGCHGVILKEVTRHLKPGTYPFTLRYFNYNGGRHLTFDVRAIHPYQRARAVAFERITAKAPACYDLWRAWEAWLADTPDTPIEMWEAFAKRAAQGLANHPRPAWDLLSRTALPKIEQTRGKDALAEFMADLHGIIRQDDRPVAEFCDFAALLTAQAKQLATDEQRFTLFRGALAGQVGTKDAFGIVMQWGGNRFLKQADTAERYVKIVGDVLREQGEAANMGKFIDGAICEASAARNLPAFQSLSDLRETLNKDPARAPLDLSFTSSPLLSDKGLLRLSTTSQWDQPGNYRAIIDGAVAAGNFHTASEAAPWAEVELPGMAEIDAVYLENVHTQNNARAVPFKLEISEDGQAWTSVGTFDKVQEDWKLTFKPVKGRFVRLTWTGKDKTFLHFRKFTVHGKKLY